MSEHPLSPESREKASHDHPEASLGSTEPVSAPGESAEVLGPKMEEAKKRAAAANAQPAEGARKEKKGHGAHEHAHHGLGPFQMLGGIGGVLGDLLVRMWKGMFKMAGKGEGGHGKADHGGGHDKGHGGGAHAH